MQSARRRLGGETNRVLEGRTVAGVAKDGRYMDIYVTNGERWRIGWADFNAGKGFAGEPFIVKIGDVRALGGANGRDGSIHYALAGKVIERASTDGDLLMIDLEGGESYGIGWADPQTQEQIKAEPCLVRVDVALTIEPAVVFATPGM